MDSWAAYAAEKRSIFDAIATVPNVIILSGDRHVEFNHLSSTEYPAFGLSTGPLNSACVNKVYILDPLQC